MINVFFINMTPRRLWGRLGPYRVSQILPCNLFFICETRAGPNRPQTKKGMFFRIFQLNFLWKPLFLANLTTSDRMFLTGMIKGHIYGPRPFIWAYNQVLMTYCSKVLACNAIGWWLIRNVIVFVHLHILLYTMQLFKVLVFNIEHIIPTDFEGYE